MRVPGPARQVASAPDHPADGRRVVNLAGMGLLSRRLLSPVVVDVAVACGVAGLSIWWWHQFRLGGPVFGMLAGAVLFAIAAAAALTASIIPARRAVRNSITDNLAAE
ncbi:MAG TPA: hypothetical protein VN408_05480 [Actinoplanes sp.]|nr:hypothetical protein [Actinoplanes sp.]